MGCGLSSRQKFLSNTPVIELLDSNTSSRPHGVMRLKYSHLGEKKILTFIQIASVDKRLSLKHKKSDFKKRLEGLLSRKKTE